MKHYYFYYQEVYLVPILSKKLNGIAVDKIVKAGLNISKSGITINSLRHTQ